MRRAHQPLQALVLDHGHLLTTRGRDKSSVKGGNGGGSEVLVGLQHNTTVCSVVVTVELQGGGCVRLRSIEAPPKGGIVRLLLSFEKG